MTEIPFGKPVNPQCEAEISIEMKKSANGVDIASGTLRCGTIFCKDKEAIPISSSSKIPQEAGFKTEIALRNIVRIGCPKWIALKDAGEVPSADLPDHLMPPFSENNY
jgi:hypothetical protein